MSYFRISFTVGLILLSIMLLTIVNRPAMRHTGVAEAQAACTPPLYQGYPSTCGTLSIMWLNRNPISQIDHFDILRAGAKIGEAPASALYYSDTVGCGFGASYTIRQVMKSGATCSTQTTGNLPHTRPCDMCTGDSPVLNVVSAANYNAPVMFHSLATIFANPGQQFTSATAENDGRTLPFTLGGTQMTVDGEAAALIYVSPTQINFLVPQARPGVSEVIITGSGGQRTAGMAYTGPNPGIFTADSSGRGVAAALSTVDGQTFKSVFDAQRQAIPIAFDPGGRPTYLILFGTSIRERGEISVKIAGQNCPVTWSGAHPGMSGLDQINVQLPSTLRGVGKTWIFTDVGGLSANQTQIHMGN